MVLEPKVVELMTFAQNIRKVIIVNGHVPGNIKKAVEGERVGTIIHL